MYTDYQSIKTMFGKVFGRWMAIMPNIFTQTAQGELYYWDSEKPSNINIENVMMSQIEATDRKSQLDNRSFLKKVKRKIKRMIS